MDFLKSYNDIILINTDKDGKFQYFILCKVHMCLSRIFFH